MRVIIAILCILTSGILLGQDSTLVANTKLVEIATEVKTLREQVGQLTSKLDAYEELAKEQKSQLAIYSNLKVEDDKLISLMQTEIQLRTNMYSEMMKDTYKPKKSGWKDALWFAGGLVVAYTGVAIATKL